MVFYCGCYHSANLLKVSSPIAPVGGVGYVRTISHEDKDSNKGQVVLKETEN